MKEADKSANISLKPTKHSPDGSRIALLLCAIVACAAPVMHQRLIEPYLDAVRYPRYPGLLPGEFLFLRYFGQLAEFFPVAFIATFAWSFIRPAHTRNMLVVGMAAFLAWTILYLCYALLIIFVLLKNEPHHVPQRDVPAAHGR